MLKLLLGFLTLLVVTGILLATVGLEPQDRRPGTRLDGELVAAPNTWEFTDTTQEVHLETYPWYGIPFSVTTVLATDGTNLYLPSIYNAPGAFPGTKFWNKVVVDNPQVRLRVAGKLYELEIHNITDPTEFDRAFMALAGKYPFWQSALEDRDKRPYMALLKLIPRQAS